MKKLIKKILKEDELLEFGMKLDTIKKYLPKNYLLKNKSKEDIEYKEYLTSISKKVNNLYDKVNNDLKNITWWDIELYYHNEFFYVVLPKKIKNNIKKLSEYYEELADNNYTQLINQKEKVRQLYEDNKNYIEDDYIYTYVDEPRNRTHFPKGLPVSLLGYDLGIKIYRKMLHVLGFIQTEPNATPSVQKLYQRLLQSPDVNVVVYRDLTLLMDINADVEYKINVLSESIYEYYKNSGWKRRLILNKTILLDSGLIKEIGVNNILTMLNDLFYESREYTHEPFSEL